MRGTYIKDNICINFSNDIVTKNSIIECKSINREVEEWYFESSLVQCAVYSSLLQKTNGDLVTSKFFSDMGNQIIKTTVDKNIDYLALGHIHYYSENKLDDRGVYAYSGCLDGRGFDETGEKGFVLLEPQENTLLRAFVPFSSRKFYETRFSVNGKDDWYAFREETINALKKEYSPDSIIKVVFTGSHKTDFEIDADGLAAQAALTELNEDKSVHGILVLRPLPARIDEDKLMRLIPAEKDVDGMGMLNAGLLLMGKRCFAPCTAQAVMELISYYGIELNGKAVCIIGRSNVAGKPLAMLLLKENATPTICHTKTADIKKACLDADIIIASAGSAGMLKADMVNEASVLIDVGINLVGGRLTGDVSREACERAAMYTPVPGGIGAVTTAVLLMHTVEAAEKAQV